jgi:hypothetical protein
MVRRVLVSAVLLAGAVAVVVPAGSASAIAVCKADYECVTTYYADAAHTVFNGEITRFCDGSTDTVGVLRGYAVTTQGECQPLD